MPFLPPIVTNGVLLQHAQAVVQNGLKPFTSFSGRLPEASRVSETYQPWQKRSIGLDHRGTFNPAAILAAKQQYQVQIIATTFGSLSVLATLIAIYWFCMMRRNFRRDLILLLIVGDLWKSSWYLIFAVTTLSRGHIQTSSSFCQVAGYMLQTGLIACDVAIVLMSLHMTLQIFPGRCRITGHDGLYRVRWWAYGAWLVLPNLSASLAFINNRGGYVSQAGFCTLPVRPFWYRLTLSWIPRYLVGIYIMGTAIRIYRHVGYEFTMFGDERDRSSSIATSRQLSCDMGRPSSRQEAPQSTQEEPTDQLFTEEESSDDDEIAPDDDHRVRSAEQSLHLEPTQSRSSSFHAPQRLSAQEWSNLFSDGVFGSPDVPIHSAFPGSRRGSRQVAAGVFAEDFALTNPPSTNKHHTSLTPTAESRRPSVVQSGPPLEPISETKTTGGSTTAEDEVGKSMKQRRRAIQRQLRVLFVYPIAYCAMWIVPFTAHAMNYSDHYAQDPIFALNALSVFFVCLMGTTDVVIFTIREKPWRHIPGSTGTFFGSFLFWRYAFGSEWYHNRRASRESKRASSASEMDAKSGAGSQPGLLSFLRPWRRSAIRGSTSTQCSSNESTNATPANVSRGRPGAPPPMHRRGYSGGSVLKVQAAERAHVRLALEKADRGRQFQSQPERQVSMGGSSIQAPPSRKEWWDMETGDDADLPDGNEKEKD